MDATRVAMALDISQHSDELLAAEAAREGSEGPAFAALFERYEERVWRVCYRLLDNADDAADAAQEVFVRLFFERTKFAGRSRYSTWVHGVALRVCLAMRRGRGRRHKHEQAAQQQQSRDERHLAPRDTSGEKLDLSAMLEILAEEDRALLIMKYAEGYNHEELAEMFELSVSACKMRIHRAVKQLQQRFPNENFAAE